MALRSLKAENCKSTNNCTNNNTIKESEIVKNRNATVGVSFFEHCNVRESF